LLAVMALRQLSSTASAPADAAAIVAKDVQEQNNAIISAREKLVIIMVRFFLSCGYVDLRLRGSNEIELSHRWQQRA
jgi:hypothetical protein